MPNETGAGDVLVGEEEALKRAFGGLQIDRSNGAFESLDSDDVAAADRPALEYFFRPTPEELKAAADKIGGLLNRAGHVLVPMHEKEVGVVAETIGYLLTRVPGHRIIVSNDRSSEEVVRMVERFRPEGVHLVDKTMMHGLVDWDALLPVLGLTEPPTRGKGQNLLGAMLYTYLVAPRAGAIVQHDADVNRPYDYDCLGALAYTMTQQRRGGDRIVYAKVAKPGRNNQTTMTARNMVGDLRLVPYLPDHVRQLAAEVYADLREHVWMLTGEFGMWRGIAYNRPFATGYGEETFMSLFVQDCIRRHPNGHREVVAQVVTPSPRLDAANDMRKEDRMMDRLSRMLQQYVLFGKPISTWEIADYTAFNRLLGQMELAARIASREDDESPEDKANGTRYFGPVLLERLAMDRMIPGVKALDKGGFLIPERVAAFRRSLP